MRARSWSTKGRAGRRLTAMVVAWAAVAAGAAPAADAKVFFADLQGRMLRWDQRVSSTIGGCPGNESCRAAVQGVTVYLRRGPVTRRAVDRRHVRRLGRISASGRLAFRVPHVTVGRYHLVARVRAGEGRRWLPVSGSFRVARH